MLTINPNKNNLLLTYDKLDLCTCNNIVICFWSQQIHLDDDTKMLEKNAVRNVKISAERRQVVINKVDIIMPTEHVYGSQLPETWPV